MIEGFFGGGGGGLINKNDTLVYVDKLQLLVTPARIGKLERIYVIVTCAWYQFCQRRENGRCYGIRGQNRSFTEYCAGIRDVIAR